MVVGQLGAGCRVGAERDPESAGPDQHVRVFRIRVISHRGGVLQATLAAGGGICNRIRRGRLFYAEAGITDGAALPVGPGLQGGLLAAVDGGRAALRDGSVHGAGRFRLFDRFA